MNMEERRKKEKEEPPLQRTSRKLEKKKSASETQIGVWNPQSKVQSLIANSRSPSLRSLKPSLKEVTEVA